MTAYDLQVGDGAVVARWTKTPTASSALALREELSAALRAAPSPPALWIVIDTGSTELPAPDARAALQDGARGLFDLSRSVDVVIVGDGLVTMLLRTVLRGMALVTRTRDRMRVHEGVEQAIADRKVGGDLAGMLRHR